MSLLTQIVQEDPPDFCRDDRKRTPDSARSSDCHLPLSMSRQPIWWRRRARLSQVSRTWELTGHAELPLAFGVRHEFFRAGLQHNNEHSQVSACHRHLQDASIVSDGELANAGFGHSLRLPSVDDAAYLCVSR